MNIAIASGKGGTGKTTISLNLALALSQKRNVTLMDCDVEEPNCALFLNLDDKITTTALTPSFKFDNDICTRCRKCADACRFNAIAALPSRIMFFPELCHGCGGCLISCDWGAVSETRREIGKISTAENGSLRFIEGRLNVGETMAPPLIRIMKRKISADELNIIDSPPGTSCAMTAAVKNCDIAALVTEPTPFGLNDLQLAVAALRELELPFAVIVNRVGIGDNRVEKYCETEDIEIIASIPDSRDIAESYSRGETLYGNYQEFSKEIDKVSVWLAEKETA